MANEGVIFRENVKILLSFLPLQGDKNTIDYKYQLESLEELDKILSNTFKDRKSLSLVEFKAEIQKNSDIYLQLLCFIYQNCPFKDYNVTIVKNKNSSANLMQIKKEKGAIMIKSKFSGDSKVSSKLKKSLSIKKLTSSENFVFNFPLSTLLSPVVSFLQKKDEVEDSYDMIKIKSGNSEFYTKFSKDVEMGISPLKTKRINSSYNCDNDLIFKVPFDKKNEGKKSSGGEFTDKCDKESSEKSKEQYEFVNEKIDYENYIYKYSKMKEAFESYWMLLIENDLYHFSEKDKKELLKVNNISGCFVKENGNKNMMGKDYYSFSILYKGKFVNYYSKDRDIAKTWTFNLRKALNYKNFFDTYEIDQNIYTTIDFEVKLGINKETRENVMVKIIEKAKCNDDELEKIYNELEMFKTSLYN